MKIERELKKVGGSVMVPIPAEILRELRWEPGLRVTIDSEGGGVRIAPAAERPPDDIAKFVARFTEKYDRALRNLSER
ncbi:MAG: AbrB/MazE/SpoVT family DNA-binding domain-containing protein [Actinomycetota bacterium]|jgi:antitoxin component of MazEF toxin-antitoxin module|nr:AbrB/MazE/SpoVT family DNA-binding domain-containing protein [Rubrobacter sp.]MDQ3567923.1 AbrB/MazE/SpoVT family DNA-binding domain-containing protein [Actinomycetota bacterium]